MLQDLSGGGVEATSYDLISQLSTFYVNTNNTTTPIEQLTARNIQYNVTFIYNIKKATFDLGEAPLILAQKSQEVSNICGMPEVQAARCEQDQGPDGRLFNYLVITVGPSPDRTTTVRVRMDSIGTPAAIAAIKQGYASVVGTGVDAPIDN